MKNPPEKLLACCPFCNGNNLKIGINYVNCIDCELKNPNYSFIVPRPLWNERPLSKQCALPEKPKIEHHYDDLDNGFNSGERSMHDKFMAVIGKKEETGVFCLIHKKVMTDGVCPKCQPSQCEQVTYPCDDCGNLRTKAEGGTTFTVCDECWDKHYRKDSPK